MTLVLGLVGTDHHPFDRLVGWMDAAADRHPGVHFVVQHGATRAPRVAEGVDYLSHDRLLALLADAAVVVCHGGPGLIMEAREAGHLPLCVPRDPLRGEHVDGHQQRFAAHLGDEGAVLRLTSVESFDRHLDSLLDSATTVDARRGATARVVSEARATARGLLAAELDELIAAGHRVRSRSASPVRPALRRWGRNGAPTVRH